MEKIEGPEAGEEGRWEGNMGGAVVTEEVGTFRNGVEEVAWGRAGVQVCGA